MSSSRYLFKEMKGKGILHTRNRFCPSRARLFSLYKENSNLFLEKYELRFETELLIVSLSPAQGQVIFNFSIC